MAHLTRGLISDPLTINYLRISNMRPGGLSIMGLQRHIFRTSRVCADGLGWIGLDKEVV
jgi:hypothetical protein